TIKKQVVKKTLDVLEEMAEKRPDDYKTFWAAYGAVLKEGLHFDFENRERIAKLVRYESSADKGARSLEEYVAAMPAGQEAIYYVIADTRKAAAGSPHIEALRKKGFEVLFMTDPVDEWAVEGLREFAGKKLVSAMRANLKLEQSDEEKKAREEKASALKPLCGRFEDVLKAHVKEVRLSDRLTDSPCCLVVPEGGMHSSMERLLRAYDKDAPVQKRVLELNPAHPVVESLEKLHAKDPKSTRVTDWIELLYDQALIGEGSPIEDPGAFARRVTSLLGEAVAREAQAG
ncbi:MAG TPA: molecular chaperone HtpG, partial [Planctomycetota bacterium]|nr:molecular chaperone HtpG [Planctomycetota bacterium]